MDYVALLITLFAIAFFVYRYKRMELYEKLSFIPLLLVGITATFEYYAISLVFVIFCVFCLAYMAYRLNKYKKQLAQQTKTETDSHV
jgi:hypothetical protein